MFITHKLKASFPKQKIRAHQCRDCNRDVIRLPSEARPTLDGAVPFRRSSDILVPTGAGVYLIHDLRGVLYVGQTEMLQRRFLEHYWLTDNQLLKLALRHSFGVPKFSWALRASRQDRARLESRLVLALNPPCNRVIPRFT